MAAARIVYKACKDCQFITEDDVCPRCGGATSKDWQGMVAIADFEKSEIAKKMGITANGTYALKVR
ncbi:DNA-directed RNA polymerase, subunit E'' [Thermoplasmatales archaeon BRNA1]|nr:DNA-directed RNA polymerase, subunit E'' [Thermoplasmatales archaeon BRNA1]